MARTLSAALQRLSVKQILLIGLVIRLVLVPITSWTDDMYAFYRVVVDMLGGLNPYDSATYTYPPLWAYTLFPPFLLVGLLVGPEAFATFVPSIGATGALTEMLVPTVTSPLFNAVMKLPLLGADVAVGLLLLRWASETYGSEPGKSVLLLWFFNPLVIWVTAVQGQFDVLPVFLTVSSAYLLLRRRFFLGGLALGLSILFKIYPLFLFLPLLFLVLGLTQLRRAGETVRERLRAPLHFVAGSAVVLAILGLPLLGTRFLEVVVLRRAEFGVVGGFNPLFFLSLDIWGQLPFAESLPRSLPSLSPAFLLTIPIVISLVAGYLWLRKRSEGPAEAVTVETVVLLAIVSLVALYSALLLVNPQHLLWVLPFLILGAFRWPRLKRLLLIVSLAGFLYLLVLQGPAAFFYPLAALAAWPSVESLNGQVEGYWALPGLISSRLQQVLIFLVSAAGYLALLFAAVYVVRGRGESTEHLEHPQSRGEGPSPGVAPAWPRFATLGIAFLIVSQGLVLAPGIPAGGGLAGASHDAAGNIVTVDLHGHRLHDTTYRVTVLGLATAPQPLPLYLYHDSSYPVSNTSRVRVVGLLDHLHAEFQRAQLSTRVTTVATSGLLSLLRGPPAILIVATTALPEVLFREEPRLLNAWLEGGSILLWVGSHVGRYLALQRGPVVDMIEAEGPGRWGPQFILGFDPVDGEGEALADVSSPIRSALEIRFPLAGWGAALPRLATHNGSALGLTSGGANPKTSVSLFPVGSGTAVLFGGAIGPVSTFSGEDIVAHDIARLLLSGLLQNPHRNMNALLATREIRIPAGEVARVFLPVEPGTSVQILRLLVQAVSPHDALIATADLVP